LSSPPVSTGYRLAAASLEQTAARSLLSLYDDRVHTSAPARVSACVCLRHRGETQRQRQRQGERFCISPDSSFFCSFFFFWFFFTPLSLLLAGDLNARVSVHAGG
ncbi:hypothetical protein ANANG_G00164090, partial [Anguilla anguilla]